MGRRINSTISEEHKDKIRATLKAHWAAKTGGNSNIKDVMEARATSALYHLYNFVRPINSDAPVDNNG